MADTFSCPECGEEARSAEELDVKHDVPEVETNDDGSMSLFENRDLFLCNNCKTPLGISRSNQKKTE